jgi:hypothetical protein
MIQGRRRRKNCRSLAKLRKEEPTAVLMIITRRTATNRLSIVNNSECANFNSNNYRLQFLISPLELRDTIGGGIEELQE